MYERIARLAAGRWNRNGQLGLVVGATYPAEIERVQFTPEKGRNRIGSMVAGRPDWPASSSRGSGRC